MAEYPMTITGPNWHETLRFEGPEGFGEVVSERPSGEEFGIGFVLARVTRDVKDRCPLEECGARVHGRRSNSELSDIVIKCEIEVCPLAKLF